MAGFSPFAQWYLLTREKALSGPNDVMINDATKHTYTIKKMMKGRGATLIKGGKYLVEQVQLVAGTTFRTYSPGEKRNIKRTSTAAQITYPWRFTEANTGTTDAETESNDGDELARFKSLGKSLDQTLITDVNNGMEHMLWQQPDMAEMTRMDTTEQNPGKLYSIPAFITESALRAPGWTGAVGGADPGTYVNWDNQRASYNQALPFGETGIFAAMSTALRRVKWDVGFSRDEFVENDDLSRLMIFTNENGLAKYESGLRLGNDQTRAGPQDPAYGKPVFNGIPIDWASQLDEEPLSETGGAYENKVYDVDEPRYFFVNGNYLYTVFKSGKVMVRKVVPGGTDQHDVETIFLTNWYNLVCTSRKRQAIVYPK
jgi:hypothetical protein